MSCEITDYKKEFLVMAKPFYDSLLNCESWEELYDLVFRTNLDTKMQMALIDCQPHKDMAKLALDAVAAAYFGTRLDCASDVAFFEFRRAYADKYNTIVTKQASMSPAAMALMKAIFTQPKEQKA